jgi:endonuclease YncB( thermonuclease family)
LLADVNPASITKFTFAGLETYARVASVVDGDTVVIILPLAFSRQSTPKLHKVRARLRGIDTCELRSHNPILRAHAERARDALRSLLQSDDIVKVTCHEADKYGRVLVDMHTRTSGGVNVSKYMIEQGYAFDCPSGSRMSEMLQQQKLQNQVDEN